MMMSNGVSNLVSASGLSGFRAQGGGQCSNTLDFHCFPTQFCQKAAPQRMAARAKA